MVTNTNDRFEAIESEVAMLRGDLDKHLIDCAKQGRLIVTMLRAVLLGLFGVAGAVIYMASALQKVIG